MILKMYSVLDSKAGFFGTPIFEQSEGSAVRSFKDAVNDGSNSNNLFFKHPEDYSLYYIGEFDTLTGNVNPNKIPLNVITASAIKIIQGNQIELPFNQNGSNKEVVS